MEKAQDVNRSFKIMKTITITSILCMAAVVSICFGVLYKVLEDRSHKAYFVTQDETYVGVEKEDNELNYYNVKNHVRKFMGLMYAHNKDNYKTRVNTALQLIDKEQGKIILNDFNKGDVYNNYVKYGSSTHVVIDSIRPNLTSLPYSVKVYAVQYTKFNDEQIPITLGIHFDLEKDYQNDINTDGIKLKNFHYFPYNRVKKDEGEIEDPNVIKEETEPVVE